ncbi:hypothetical protein DFA_09375 [Cavenderia fasciculata]|uniref:Uncharacterized protein n=1 Tax=Cavenderia fasciculata TaxID=261658 RepID=F4Q7G2_CACFS|nr:uncharacterized protein DFA_09375 [Cavenderia fasciculata]EGG16344.1 hypothetical protein DFA_09375 [Cavenderia fasciculata]|eukprot:XP_004354728.1 hypothetical protein DFA_09375 [Cavenderia fasciculata]
MCISDKEEEVETTSTTSTLTSNTIKEEEEEDDELYLKDIQYQESKHLIIDSHCHIQEDQEMISMVENQSTYPMHCSWLMGTTVEDWDRVDRYADKMGDRALRCYGIHPWFAYQYHPPKELIDQKDNDGQYRIDDKWYIELEKRLIKYPNAMVGELGIDKVTKVKATGKNDLDGQWEVLKRQFKIAVDHNRLLSLHCVQLQGKLLDYFISLPLDQFPKKIALHTFSGKPAMVRSLLKLKDKGTRLYFGISFINLSSSKVLKLIEAIPDDRLLLESDQNTPEYAESSIYKVLVAISKAKNWSIKVSILNTQKNAIAFQNN